jgi:transcriptional regulator with XRE-family HTH domain
LKIKMSHRSWVHALLQRTGISQADLAGFLDISRSTVAMACANERDLPNEARWQLYKIEQAMETLPPGAASPFTSYAPLIKYCQSQARKLRYEAAVMERFIEKYDQKLQQWEQREKFWRAAGTLLPDGEAGHRQAEWLKLLVALLTRSPKPADKKYYRCKAQLPLLLQEAAAYEQWVAEWEKA